MNTRLARVAQFAASKLSARSKTRKPVHSRMEPLEDRIAFAVHDWTGLGADNLWSNPQNWTNGTPAADLSGDVDLVFHTNLVNAANLVTQNDLANLTVDSITFDASVGSIGPTTFANGGTSDAGYTINGNAITINTSGPGQDPFGIDIANNVTTGAGITETFNTDVNLATSDATFRSQQNIARLTITGDMDLGARTLTIDNTTGLGNNFTIQGVTLNGDISNGSLTKNGSGTLDLGGDNSYGALTVNGGYVLAETNTALGTVSGIITVNDPGQVQLRNGITVVKLQLNLNSNSTGGGLGADGGTTNTFRGTVNLMAGNGGVALGAGFGTANAATRLIIDGGIGGATSTLFINGSGTVEFARNNFYVGQTNLNGNQGPSTLQIDTPAGLGIASAGNESIVSSGNTLLLNFNGTLGDNFNGERLQIAGGGVGGAGAVRALGNSNVIIPGAITLIAGTPWNIGVDGTLGSITTTGIIDSQGANRALTKVGAGTLVIDGGAVPNTFQGGVVVNGGLLSVINSSPTPLGTLAGPSAGLVTVNATGTLRVAGSASVPNPVQLTGGTLAGNGLVTGVVNSTGGTISPGFGGTSVLGVFNNVTLDGTSTFHAEINGTTAGSSYDQLSVIGNVNLGGAALDIVLGFSPAVNDTFTLVNNAGLNAVTGTFAGLAEGDTFLVGSTFFTISYAAGAGGNDVVLTAVAPPPPPDIAIDDVALTEGNSGLKDFTFTVTRSGSLLQSSTVNFTVAAGTATVGSDYIDNSGPIVFATGETSKQITIQVKGDNTVEGNETFFVNLTPGSNANITDAQGQGTINNDDSSGTVSIVTDPTNGSKKSVKIVGTNNSDTITVTQNGTGQGSVKVNINGVNKGTFNFTGVIQVYGNSGNDNITIAPGITRTAYVFGGEGKDTVSSGGGNDVLVGGDGDDTLKGNSGRDIVIGGNNVDNLDGGAGDDILVAGGTIYDTNVVSLSKLLAEWQRTDASYSTRASHIKNGGGLNGSIKLNTSTTGSGGGVVDTLTGGSNTDLFYAAVPPGDIITDKVSGEQVVDVG